MDVHYVIVAVQVIVVGLRHYGLRHCERSEGTVFKSK